MSTVGMSRKIVLLAVPSLLLVSSVLFLWEPSTGALPRRVQAAEDVPPISSVESWTLPNVRLNFFGASWQKILTELAEQSGSTLVMDRVPAGNLTRRDRDMHTRADAVRILNRELEKTSFRVLERGRHLVVLHLDSVRSTYRRPAVTSRESTEPAKRPGKRVTVKPRSEVHTIQPSRKPEPVARPKPRPQAGAIVQASFENDEAKGTVIPVRTENHSATDLGRLVYQAFKSRAELINKGSEGLPAFQVFHPHGATEVADRDVQFSVGIDTKWDHLVVSGAKEQAEAVKRLIHRLDSLPIARGKVMQLASTTKDARQVADRLRPVVRQLIAQNDPPKPAAPKPNDPAAAKQPGAEPQDDPQNPDAPGGLQDVRNLEGALKGEVSVESMNELGVLILRGNQADVDAVMKVIRELDELAFGTTPHIHLRELKFVHSETLTELLTSVYEKLNTPPSGAPAPTITSQTVSFIAVGKPNAILVLAADRELQSILDLIDNLDQPVDPQHEFAVFSLKNAIASQVVTMLDDFYAERGGLGVRISVTQDIRTNSVIVHARPRDLAEVSLLIRKLDKDEPGKVSQMRIVVLKNAVAEELALVINNAIQSVLTPAPTPQTTGGTTGGLGGGQTNQELREAASAALQFLTGETGKEQAIQSGILADIRLTADARTNSLLISAPKASMQLVEEMVRQLDKPTDTVAEIKVFTLANADASSVAELLAELLVDEEDENQTGVQLVGAEDASSSLVPLKFSVDMRSNSILAVGGGEALRIVEAIVLRLDEGELRQRESLVYRLKNAPASDVAEAVNQFLDSQRELEESDPDLVSAFERIEREVIVVPEPVSNSLLISATERYFSGIQELVVELDETPAQVIIQVLLVEVVLDDTDEFGLELGFQDPVLFDRTTVATTSPGFPFNNQPLGNNTVVSPAEVGLQGLSNFGMGRVNSTLGFGGLVLSASSNSVSMLLRALQANREVEILSRPQIRTVDNQLAEIQVGQQVPIVTGVNIGTSGIANPNITQDEAGIILSVTPRINPDGLIVMETVAEKSQYRDSGVAIFTDAATGNTIESPIKDITTVRTTVAVPNGQTIVLGGMITETDESVVRKVPWLGDIPILGRGFRFDGTGKLRSELLVFLTPRIIQDDADNEVIKQIEAERTHFSEQNAEAIQGPLYAVPQQNGIDDGNAIPLPPDAFDDDGIPTSVMPRLEPVPETSAVQQRGSVSQASYVSPAKKPKRRSALPRWFDRGRSRK